MVTPTFWPDAGGVQTHIVEVGQRLIAAGVGLTVVTTAARATQQWHQAGFEVVAVRGWPAHVDFRVAPAVVRIIGRRAWDVIHCQSYHTMTTLLSMPAALASGLPYVVTFHSGGHSSPLRRGLRPAQLALLRPFLARAKRLICVSNFERQLFQRRLRLPDSHFTVIPNGAAVRNNAVNGAANGQHLIVSPGRLERYKGHQKAVAALPHVLRTWPDARLRIAGSGPYEHDLRALASRLGVASAVDIQAVPAGRTDEMTDLLRAASVVTVLSDYESQGLSALDAVAAGRPVVVTNATALAELSSGGLAHGVPADANGAEVAAAVVRAVNHHGTHSHAVTAPAMPTWDATAQELLRMYRQVACAA